jgi:hypothetical protein
MQDAIYRLFSVEVASGWLCNGDAEAEWLLVIWSYMKDASMLHLGD